MFQNSTLPSVSADITGNLAGSLPRLRVWQGLARLDTLLPLPNTFGEYLVWLLALVCVTALALLQINVSLQISQTELELNGLRNRAVLMEQENAQLLWEISQFTTLERVEAEASAAGFVPALKRRYVSVEPLSAAQPAMSVVSVPVVENGVKIDWSLDVESGGIVDRLSPLWTGWAGGWEALLQNAQESVTALGDSVQQGFLRLDISPFIWSGQKGE